MKDILKKAGQDVKLRLRGKGSGFVEHSTNKESEEALQLCISCTSAYGYDMAVQCVDSLLRKTYADYDRWCIDKGIPARAPEVHLRERNPPDRNSRSYRDQVQHGGPVRKTKGRNKRKDGDYYDDGPEEDKGEQPPGAPDAEEIERLIEERNKARKDGNYSRADEIRDQLSKQKVVLSDEKGAAGQASKVTTWRYWRE